MSGDVAVGVGVGVGLGLAVAVGVRVGNGAGVSIEAVGGARGGACFCGCSVYFNPSVATTIVP